MNSITVAPTEPFHVAIDARLSGDGHAGGVEQFVASLVYGLGRLPDGDEQYTIFTDPSATHWLDDYVGPNQHIVTFPSVMYARWKRMLGPLRPRIAKAALKFQRNTQLPSSNRIFETVGVNLVHFPYQRIVETSVPSIYNPHDLQHRHLPEFFTREELAWREYHYKAACVRATSIAVASKWIKQDIVTQMGIEPSKIQVIPDAIPTELCKTVTVPSWPKQLPAIPDNYILYPAQTWPHKNHLRLLDALAINRDHHRIITHLVCTGRQNDHWPAIKRRIGELGLQQQVHFTGFIDAETLRNLYEHAQFMVMPTLHESVSYPVFEAFAAGVPVACSTVTSLPEQCGEAAILFDPLNADDIARALRLLATDVSLRKQLSAAGRKRATLFSAERTARAYRALYRKVANRHLTSEDVQLLNNNWMAILGD